MLNLGKGQIPPNNKIMAHGGEGNAALPLGPQWLGKWIQWTSGLLWFLSFTRSKNKGPLLLGQWVWLGLLPIWGLLDQLRAPLRYGLLEQEVFSLHSPPNCILLIILAIPGFAPNPLWYVPKAGKSASCRFPQEGRKDVTNRHSLPSKRPVFGSNSPWYFNMRIMLLYPCQWFTFYLLPCSFGVIPSLTRISCHIIFAMKLYCYCNEIHKETFLSFLYQESSKMRYS